jgi:hypothetical protein
MQQFVHMLAPPQGHALRLPLRQVAADQSGFDLYRCMALAVLHVEVRHARRRAASRRVTAAPGPLLERFLPVPRQEPRCRRLLRPDRPGDGPPVTLQQGVLDPSSVHVL